MRAGGCAVQKALTTDAAAVVKQAVTLAKRRGHAQVTPLHVANTMLVASSGLFRVACEKSHSHPLQCKALELCFNVALNRLPATSSSPILGPHSQHPSISNALVAAFKRAQAHQRRGSIENQQQAVLAVKIDLDQLIISILDDPSVSRVMREAGFSSTQVKTNVQKSVSLDPSLNPSRENIQNERKITFRNEDAEIIIETMLMRKKSKSLVIVGECISNLESTVKGLMDKVDKKEVPGGLSEIKFLTIPPLYSFCNLGREEVEQQIGELRCLVNSLLPKGIVLYLGDFKWISEYRVDLEQERGYYCSVQHMIMEIGKLVCGIRAGNFGKFWLMGIASFQTYMRCRSGNYSLESVWGLHPVTIPVNSLGLSLISQRIEAGHTGGENISSDQLIMLTNGEVKLSCCRDCSAQFEIEARNIQNKASEYNEPTLSRLPPWLKEESRRLNSNYQNYDEYLMRDKLCKKWNSFCNSTHKTLTISSSSPSSCFSPDQQNPNLHNHFPFSFKPNSTPNSISSSDLMEMDYTQKFNEFNAENLNTLCDALETKVPLQREIIPEIVGTVLQCRSGMLKRIDQCSTNVKQETWMFFLGLDVQARDKISRELAKAVFGSYSNFVRVGRLSGNNLVLSDFWNTRVRDEVSCCGYMEGFAKEVSVNPHRVFLVEDLDQMDYVSQMTLKRAIERGIIVCKSEEEVSFFDAIIVLSSEKFGFGRSSRVGSPCSKEKMLEYGKSGREEEEMSACVSLDLNISVTCESVKSPSHDDLGIMEIVDKRVFFNIKDS